MAITKIHAIKSTMGKAIAYIENSEKTEGQLLVSGYNTEPQMAAVDFEMTATLARKVRHSSSKKSSNLAYHLMQSFSPDDDLTPQQAHELGKKLAAEFTEGRFEYVVATHIDKGHLHNHIMINAVSFYDYRKLRTVPYRTAAQIRSISDRLCAEAELSVIDSPQRLGRQYSEYAKKKKQTPVRTEIRRRLNFCLDRATDYAQFKKMVAELGIQMNDGGKYVSYRYEGAGKAVRDHKLADTDKYTVNGIRERLENNDAAQKQIRDALAALLPQATTLTELQEKLQQSGVQLKFDRQTGAVHYLARVADEYWMPGDALGAAYTASAIEKGLSAREISLADGVQASLLEQYKATVRTRPDTADTLVTLSTEQILHSTSRGLVVQTSDRNGNPAQLMVPREQVEATPDGRVQIAIGSQYEYDIVCSGATHSVMRGGELIRQIELANNVRPLLIQLSAEQIKTMSLKGVTVTLPQAGIERVFIPAEYVRYDKAAGSCVVALYKNWNYSYAPVPPQNMDSGIKIERRNLTGQELAQSLDGAAQPSIQGASLKRRIAYVERKAKIANIKQLAGTLLQMQDHNCHTATDFLPQLQCLNAQIHDLQKQIGEIETKNKQYALAARCLQTCRAKALAWKQYTRQPALLQKAFYILHRDDLDAYQKAAATLEQLGVRAEVDPQKVIALIRDRTSQSQDIEKRIVLLTEQKKQVLAMKNTVVEIQTQKENDHENSI